MLRKYYITQSPIHGVGVFASCALMVGDTVGTVEMILVGKVKDYTSLPTVGIVTADGNIFVPISGFPLWAVNYSRTPNVEADREGVVIVSRYINSGEELTINSFVDSKL